MNPAVAWVTGAGGFIGYHLARLASEFAPGFTIRGLTRETLPLEDFSAMERAFRKDPPALIVHAAAMSRTGECQADPARARRVNVDATRHLAHLAAEIPFIFFSTDLVFDGRKGAYEESDPVQPLSCYAETKAEAEHAVLANRRHVVVRTSLNVGRSRTGDRSFNEEMRRELKNGRTLHLFTDEFRCPIPVEVTARAVWELATGSASGLFHLAGSERLSRWEIGGLLASRWPEVTGTICPGSLREYQGPPRAADTSLNCTRLARRLSFPLPGLRQWLEQNPHAPV